MKTIISLFFPVYITIYLLGYFAFFRKYKGTSRAEASSCLISLVHGTPSVVLATCSLLVFTCENSNLEIFSSRNTDFQNMVLEYSMAYFSTDLLHYFIFLPHDIVFIAHHLATLYVFATCRYMVNYGAQGLLALLVLAEVTSACQNTLTLARLRCRESPVAAVVVEYLSPVFYLFYFAVRGILGPIFVYKMSLYYFSGMAGELVPKWAWVSWLLVIVCAVFFSVLWVFSLMIVWWRGRKEEKKMT